MPDNTSDNSSVSTIESPAIETAGFEANESADLSPEETLAVDNFLLSQGIDSGNNYIEKIDKTISNPETDDENISSNVLDYVETKDPEVLMNSLSKMNDAELDQAISLIELGEVEQLREIFEKIPETEVEIETSPKTEVSTETGTELETEAEKETEAEQETPSKTLARKKLAWELDPTLPDFDKVDQPRKEQLKSIMIEHREARKEKKAPPAGKAAEKIKNPEVKKAKKPEMKKDEVKIEREMTKAETFIEEQSSGVVAYDYQENMLLRDVKIALVKIPNTDTWMLPQAYIDNPKKQEEETEKKIKKNFDLKINIEDELGHEKDTLTSDHNKVVTEKKYYIAESDSSKEPKVKDVEWVTLGDIQSKDYKMSERDLDMIVAAAKKIKKEHIESK